MMSQPFYQDFHDHFFIWSCEDMGFAPHLHTHLEIYYAFSGKIAITIGYQTRVLNEGDIAFAFPHRIHSYQTEAGDTSRGALMICPLSYCPEFAQLLLSEHPSDPFLPKEMIHPDVAHAIAALFQSIARQAGPQLIRAYLQLLLAHTVPLLPLVKNRDKKSPDDTGRLIEYVSEHYLEPMSLQTIADALSLSIYQISRIFCDKLQTTFSGYVNALRIQSAQILLQRTQMDILAIAYASGFETTRTFNRAFQAVCSCTPREYRLRFKLLKVNVKQEATP